MSVVDPQIAVATTEMKLAALFNRLENRCSMEAAGRLRPLPVDKTNQTAVNVETKLSVTQVTNDDATQLTAVPGPLVVDLARCETDVVIIRGIITKAMAEILVNNPQLAVAVSEKIYKDMRLLLEEKKPFLKDDDAILAGTSVLTFKLPNGQFLFEQENGDFEYRGSSDCIPYPAAFLK